MFVIEAGGELNLAVEKLFVDSAVLEEFQVLEILEHAPEIERAERAFVSPAAGKVCDECNSVE